MRDKHDKAICKQKHNQNNCPYWIKVNVFILEKQLNKQYYVFKIHVLVTISMEENQPNIRIREY